MINETASKKVASYFRALGHPVRLAIIRHIDELKNPHVNQIYKALDMEQSLTSQHLKILRDAQILNTKRNGKFILYSINYDRLKKITESIDRFLENESQ